MLLYRGFTFNSHCATKMGQSWRCSSRSSKNCKVTVYTTEGLRVTKVCDVHTHDPPMFHITSQGEYIRICSLSDVSTRSPYGPIRGVQLYLHRKTKHGQYWRCSSRNSRNCKIIIYMTNDPKVTRRDNRGMVRVFARDDSKFLKVIHKEKRSKRILVYVSLKHGEEPQKVLELLESRKGRPMVLYKGYTFNPHIETKLGRRWYCSSKVSKNCKAYLNITHDMILRGASDVHNHGPPKFHVTSDVRELTTQRGKPMVMFKGFTFNAYSETKYERRWACSSRITKKCKAFVYTTHDMRLTKMNDTHNHDPPKYYITSSGHYVRV
ncbi:hypothetical protein EVAR_9196_1 [Eumeta japonica]|uniref:FLYWCH-type domain-containing protein n=1 Tax=Eumeta variegata TaxID=151549 RepID=A0A4C1WQA6_EUMVA|nr:hypothetical protein EVAR_9196_1 [Eumeta japonica]